MADCGSLSRLRGRTSAMLQEKLSSPLVLQKHGWPLPAKPLRGSRYIERLKSNVSHQSPCGPGPRPLSSVQEGHAEVKVGADERQENGTKAKGKKKKRRKYRFSKTELRSMDMLEWSKVCKQVASFAMTPPAAQRAYTGKLLIGETVEESQELIEQTKEALDIELNFDGVFDLRKAIEASRQGAILHPLVIGAFATTLESVDRIVEQLAAHEGCVHLKKIVQHHDEFDSDLAALIHEKINVKDGRILDSASSELAKVREERKANFESLGRMADEWARKMQSCGASERAQVVIRRDRRCIPVKAGRNGELPKGSVVLATSGSKSTMYMEPEPLIPLNNAETYLSEAEKREESLILEELSKLIAKNSGKITRVLSAITKLDLAFARAQHALWMRGEKPNFNTSSVSEIVCRQVYHPLLLEPHVQPLPQPNLPQASGFSISQESFSSALEGINLIPELWDRDEKGELKRQSPTQDAVAETSKQDYDFHPVPIDFLIPSGKTAVIVTGPNTGGKTASLKTFGLISLMAKAGLFIPTAGDSSEREMDQIQMKWFDKVLVDVGDAQSLQQNLSTFSGHVKRIKDILADTTGESLVLMDEVGSGTDPTEGAALATSILQELAYGGAAMTYVTTHHAELKELASESSNFIDANVEFNVKTFLPTYKMIWGSSGESHALAVAEGLGFDMEVIQNAREIAARLKEDSNNRFLQVDAIKESLPEQISSAEADLEMAKASLRKEQALLEHVEEELSSANAELALLEKEEKATEIEKLPAVDAKLHEIKSLVQMAKSGEMSISDADKALKKIADEARAVAASRAIELIEYDEELTSEDSKGDKKAAENWLPAVGEEVLIVTMAGKMGTIESLSKNKATVRAGMLSMEVKLTDLRPSRKKPQKPRGSQEKYRKEAAPSNQASTATGYSGVAIQTSQNTVDVRGESADDAVRAVQDALGTFPPGSILFVVHGVGKTGRVRAAVLEFLRKDARVEKCEQQEGSQGGCAVVYLHRNV